MRELLREFFLEDLDILRKEGWNFSFVLEVCLGSIFDEFDEFLVFILVGKRRIGWKKGEFVFFFFMLVWGFEMFLG